MKTFSVVVLLLAGQTLGSHEATVEITRKHLSELQNSGQNQNDISLGNLTKPTSEHALAGTAITVIDTPLPERLPPNLLILGCTEAKAIDKEV